MLCIEPVPSDMQTTLFQRLRSWRVGPWASHKSPCHPFSLWGVELGKTTIASKRGWSIQRIRHSSNLTVFLLTRGNPWEHCNPLGRIFRLAWDQQICSQKKLSCVCSDTFFFIFLLASHWWSDKHHDTTDMTMIYHDINNIYLQHPPVLFLCLLAKSTKFQPLKIKNASGRFLEQEKCPWKIIPE